jgi:hypothetical protein
MIGVVTRIEERDVAREFFELFKTPWELWRPDGCYEVVIDDGAASHHPLAKLVVIYGSQATAFDHERKTLPGPQRSNVMLSDKGDRIPVYGKCVAFPGATSSPLVLEDTRESAVSVTRSDGSIFVRIGYDLFHEIGFLLTQGQPPTHAAIPTLERHIAFLRNCILSSGIPLVEIPPIPEGYRFMVCLTHDVDHPFIRLHKFDHTMVGFLYRAVVGSLIGLCTRRVGPATLRRNWTAALLLPFVHLGWAKDFWSEFDRYLEIDKGLGSTFFVIPVRNRPGRTIDGEAPRMRASSYGVSDIAEKVLTLLDAGCEIALHGIDAWLDSASGLEERQLISRATGTSTLGTRMHWLFWDERAPERLEEAGFSYDSTLGYNDTVGFRAGTMQAFKPITARRLLELPLIIMDTALFYPSYLNLTPEAAMQAVRPLVDDAERYGGALTINWHDRSLAPERLWGEVYTEFVDELRRRAAWFPTAAGAAAWFRRRRSTVFASVCREDTAIQVIVSTDRAEEAPGLTLRVHRPMPPPANGPVPLGHSARFTDLTFTDSLNVRVAL